MNGASSNVAILRFLPRDGLNFHHALDEATFKLFLTLDVIFAKLPSEKFVKFLVSKYGS